MRSYVDHELESTIQNVERLLSRGRNKTAGLAEARDITKYVAHDLLARTRFAGTLPPELQQTLHQIVSRTDAASTGDQLRDVIRDLRQYSFALASFNRTQEVEARMRELETQVQ
ncbi:MAG TPA: hypothetical protein VHL59_06220, partial [Thermoanaerobaculia bacterium]|nr:hypothetical protein [Thermoanaerobaculia bacterium]